MNNRLLRVLLVVLPCLFCIYANAAQVRAVKGNRMLIQLQGSQFNVGDIVRIEDDMGHVKGLGKIIKVAGQFAEAVFRGSPQVGYTVVIFPKQALERALRRIRQRRQARSGGHEGYLPSEKAGQSTYGVMVGYNSSGATVKLGNGNSVKLSGTGLGLTGFMDRPFRDWLSFRGAAGFDQLNLAGASDPTNNGCTGTNGACNAKIDYLSLDLLARFTHHFWHGTIWGGGGVDVLFPISKSSTALQPSSITSIMAYMLAAGYDFHFGTAGSYIPIQLQYQMYPSSATVTAHAIEFNVGYAKAF